MSSTRKNKSINYEALDASELIEWSEKVGQRRMNEQQVLPKDMNGYRKILEELGFKFFEDADDLFIYTLFPDGWTKRETEHSMWSDLLDPKNRRRGSIFYKAAFYDRSAHLTLLKRYIYTVDPADGNWRDTKGPRVAIAKDTADGRELWRSSPYTSESFGCEWYEVDRLVGLLAKAWLDLHYPDWDSVKAYWD